jgi:hypothetical protein
LERLRISFHASFKILDVPRINPFYSRAGSGFGNGRVNAICNLPQKTLHFNNSHRRFDVFNCHLMDNGWGAFGKKWKVNGTVAGLMYFKRWRQAMPENIFNSPRY